MTADVEQGTAGAPAAQHASTSHDDGQPKVTATTDMEKDSASAADPPLPDEEAPPLPDEPLPDQQDDGWEARWEPSAQAWYFLNHKTGVSQWENPRVPEDPAHSHNSYDRNPANSASAGASATTTTSSGAPGTSSPPRRIWGGYNPAIHGSFDPNADYAREASKEQDEEEQAVSGAGLKAANGQNYAAQAHFNRFTGKFQQAGLGPEMHNDENKSKRQMTAFFDVDAAANSHDGRSLKAERRGKTLSKKELKAYKQKRHEKKEEKRRGWLLD